MAHSANDTPLVSMVKTSSLARRMTEQAQPRTKCRTYEIFFYMDILILKNFPFTKMFSHYSTFISNSGERCEGRNGQKKISWRSQQIKITTCKRVATLEAEGIVSISIF